MAATALAVAIALGLAAAPFSLGDAHAATGCANADRFVTSDSAALERTFLCLLNRQRARHGLGRLRRNPRLRRAARAHVADMLRRRYLSHVSPTGMGPLQRALRTHYGQAARVLRVGEVIGIGFTGVESGLTPRTLVGLWLRSPAHRRTVLSPIYREAGLGATFFRWAGRVTTALVVCDLGERLGVRR